MIGFQIAKRARKVDAGLAAKFRELPVANVSDCMSRITAGGPRIRPMHGGGAFKTPWPQHATTLPRDDRIALQKRLAELGYDVKLFNGPITFEQRDYIRAEQVKLGMLPDGHASAALLAKMGIGMGSRRP